MKFTTALFFFALPARAFVVHNSSPQQITALSAAQPKAITAALEASKKFGATSSEARLAWAEVEEMDSRDNSAAMGGSMDDECELDEDMQATQECMEYSEKLDILQSMIKSPPKQQQALDVPPIKLAKSSAPSKKPTPSPALAKAVKAAQDAAAKYGKESREAIVAWSEVEDVAASGLANALGSGLNEEECSIVEEAAMEACQALEGLNNAIQKQTS